MTQKDKLTYMTYPSRTHIDLLDPKPEDFDIRDIAWALSKECRFGNHIPVHYSVAEHSIHAACIAGWSCWRKYLPTLEDVVAFQKQMFMHEGGEVIWRDMPSPNKKALPEYKLHENRIRKAICDRFKVQFPTDGPLRDLEKEIDNLLYSHENKVLRRRPGMEIPNFELHLYSQEAAYSAFLDMYHLLWGVPPGKLPRDSDGRPWWDPCETE